MVPHCTPQRIAEAVREHLDPGADPACVHALGHGPEPIDDYRATWRRFPV